MGTIPAYFAAALAVLVSFATVGCGDTITQLVEGEPAPQGGDAGVLTGRMACDTDEDCDNSVFCDGAESCESGVCVAGSPPDCDDGVDCTLDRCSELAMGCESTAPDADGDGHPDATCTDADGMPLGDDCDDGNPGRFPGNPEVCSVVFIGSNLEGMGDGIDEDCDPTTVGNRDADGDKYFDRACFNRDGDDLYAGRDCDDDNASIHPDASEVCDYFDNNCNGEVDEGLRLELLEDPDGDGFAGTDDPDNPGQVILVAASVCAGAVRVAHEKTDCAPNDRLISPARDELCDGVDNDCDLAIDEDVAPSLWFRDADRDGYGDPAGGTRSTCERIDHLGWSIFAGDCDDSNSHVNPGQVELCDGLDNDCNEDTTYLIGPGNAEDDDNDGAADPLCGTLRPDCVDTNAAVYPGALELCDGIDNDCNGIVDTRTDVAKWYVDADGDGFGDNAVAPVSSCEPVPNRITRGGDCDDQDAALHPESADTCAGVHGLDDDCDGEVDEGEAATAYYADLDGDGYGAGDPGYACATPGGFVAMGGDCDDDNPAIHPAAAEVCTPAEGIDQDCDGLLDCRDNQCNDAPLCQALFGIVFDESVNPAPTTALVSDTIEVSVLVTNDGGGPVESDLVITGEPGCLVPSGVVSTDVNGKATFTIGVGMKEQAYNFLVENGESLPLPFTINAIYPGEGAVWTVVGDGTRTNKANTFGPHGSTGRTVDFVLASDGGAFVSSETDIYEVSPVGEVRHIAGTGTTHTAGTGDNGYAAEAILGQPHSLALDESRQRLYLESYNRIRMIDLASDPYRIYHFAGGGGGPVPATTADPALFAGDANIGLVYDLEVAPDGSVLVSTNTGYYVIEPDLIEVSRLLDGVNTASPTPTAYVYGSLTARSDGSIWIGARFNGLGLAGFNGQSPGTVGIGLLRDGVIERVMGSQPPSSGMGNNFDLYTSALYQSSGAPGDRTVVGRSHIPRWVAEDAAGNLLFASTASNPDNFVDGWHHRIQRQDGASRYVRNFTNLANASSPGPEYLDRELASTPSVLALHAGTEGDLWFVEYTTGRLRRVRKGAVGSLGQVSMVRHPSEAGDVQTLWPGQPMDDLRLSVTHEGNGLVDIPVFVAHSGDWVGVSSRVYSGLDGAVRISGRAALDIDSYVVAPSLRSLDSSVLASDSFSYQVVRPPSGSVTSVANANFASTSNTLPLDGSLVLTQGLHSMYGLATASDGSVYFVAPGWDNCCNWLANWVGRIRPDGTFQRIAGSSTGGQGNNDVVAVGALLDTPTAIALDEPGQRLFFVDDRFYGNGTDRIRMVELSTGLIRSFAGYGSDTGDGRDAVTSLPWEMGEIEWSPDGRLYVTNTTGIDRINPDAGTPTVDSWLTAGTCTGAPTEFKACSSSSLNGVCSLAFRPDGKVYVGGVFCGTAHAGDVAGVALVDADGNVEQLVAGGGAAETSLVPLAPSGWLLDHIRGLTLANDGSLYIADYDDHRLWRLSADHTTLDLVVGTLDTIAAGSTSYGPGDEVLIDRPLDTALMPDGSVIFSEWGGYNNQGNRAIRRYWP